MRKWLFITGVVFYMTKRWALRPFFDWFGSDFYWNMYDVANMVILLMITLSFKINSRFERILKGVTSSVFITDIIDLGIFGVNEFRLQDVAVFIITLLTFTLWEKRRTFLQKLKIN